MQITIRFPAFVTARQKGGRIARPTVILAEAEFTVTDLSSDQAPLAFVATTNVGARTEFRRQIRDFDGRLFGQVEPPRPQSIKNAEPTTLDALVEAVSTDPLNRQGFLSPIVDKVRYSTFGPFEHGVVPSGIHTALYSQDVTDAHPLVAACFAMKDQIVTDDEVIAEIEGWRVLVQDQLDRYVSVDGDIYVHCGEPVYCAESPVSIVYPETGTGIGLMSFRATDRDGAEAEFQRKDALRGPDAYRGLSSTNVIEVADENAVTWRAEERDLDRYARQIENSTRSYIAKIGDQYSDVKIPRSVYESWLDLRDLLDGYDPALEPTPEELEPYLRRAIAEWAAYVPRLPERVKFVSAHDPETAEIMFARYEDRTIDIGSCARNGFRP